MCFINTMMHVYNLCFLIHVCNEIDSLHVYYMLYLFDYQSTKAIYVMM